MKKYISIILFFLFKAAEIFSQNYQMPFFKETSKESFVVDISVLKNNKIIKTKDSIIHLKNGISVSKFKIFERTIQNTEPNKLNTIIFFVAYENEQMLMVVDNNHNGNLSDDSVYTYTPKKVVISNKGFKNSLPLIRLDSLEKIDTNGSKKYYSTNIRFCPTLKFNDLFSGYSSALKDKEMNLLIFSDSFYFTKAFLINDIYYHIEIVPHSFVYPVYPLYNSKFSIAKIALIKHITQDSLVLAGFQIVEYMLDKDKEMTFQNIFFKLKNYDFISKKIEFEIKKNINYSDSNLSHFAEFKHQSLKDNKMHSILISQNRYTVIEFGGSWCKPCNEIIPQIESFILRKGDSVNFISIFKEGNLSNAIKYYKSIKPKWDTYFEPLKCNSKECLSNLFDVGVYPAILLLDSKGNLLFRANGSNCINDLELFLNGDMPKKQI